MNCDLLQAIQPRCRECSAEIPQEHWSASGDYKWLGSLTTWQKRWEFFIFLEKMFDSLELGLIQGQLHHWPLWLGLYLAVVDACIEIFKIQALHTYFSADKNLWIPRSCPGEVMILGSLAGPMPLAFLGYQHQLLDFIAALMRVLIFKCTFKKRCLDFLVVDIKHLLCGVVFFSSGPPRMSPKAQRHPRGHRVSTGRGTISSGLEFVSHNAPGEASTAAVARGSPSGGTWSSVVSGGR